MDIVVVPDTNVKNATVPKLLSAREVQVNQKSRVALHSGCSDLVSVIHSNAANDDFCNVSVALE